MASVILASLNLVNCVAKYLNFVYQLTTLSSVFEILLYRKSAICYIYFPGSFAERDSQYHLHVGISCMTIQREIFSAFRILLSNSSTNINSTKSHP